MFNQGTNPLLLVLAAVAPVLAAAAAGTFATIPNVETWYAHLIKPTFIHRIGCLGRSGPLYMC